jgi:hypothetical protein
LSLGFAGALLVLSGAAAGQQETAETAPPEAGRRFEGLKDQFTLVLPAGWAVYDQTAAFTGAPGPIGMVYFSAEPLSLAPGTKVLDGSNPEAFDRVDRGDVPSFFVDRIPAEKGMSCERLTRNAMFQIESLIARDEIFGGLARQLLLPRRPSTSDITLAGCQALKLKGHGRVGPTKTGWLLDVRAVSDGKTLYLFSLRNTTENFLRNLETFEAAMASLQLASPGS